MKRAEPCYIPPVALREIARARAGETLSQIIVGVGVVVCVFVAGICLGGG